TFTNLPNTAPTNVLTVAGDGSGKYTKIQDAIAAAVSGTLISIAPGTYSLATADLLNIAVSNIWIQGSGVGVTKIQADTTVTGSTAMVQAQGAVSGTSRNLTVNTAIGDTTVTMSTSDSSAFSVGDYVLIRSN